MARRILVALVLVTACTAEPFPLEPLSEADQAPFVGFTCSVELDGAVVYLMDTEAGAIRHRGRLVRLVRARPRESFDPADDRTLAMTEASGAGLSVTFEARPGAAVGDDATESFTRPVRIAIATPGEPRPYSFDSELTCAS